MVVVVSRAVCDGQEFGERERERYNTKTKVNSRTGEVEKLERGQWLVGWFVGSGG